MDDLHLTRAMYADIYHNLPVPFMMIDLEVIDAMVNAMNAEDLKLVKEFLDIKIEMWKSK
jgi:hypothetical protein